MAIGSLLGAGMFVIMVVSGSCMIIKVLVFSMSFVLNSVQAVRRCIMELLTRYYNIPMGTFLVDSMYISRLYWFV